MSSDTWLVLGALALGLVVLLLLVLLLRQPRVQLPPEWLARLQALEQAGLATQLAVAKNDGALDAMGQQLRAFTQTTQVAQESLRQAVDERLAQAVGESRAARGELASTLAAFRTELVATTGALAAESVKSREALAHSSAQAQERIQERFEALTQATRQSLDSLKADIHTQLLGMANTLRDQLSDNSQQLRTQFSFLQESVHQQLSGLVQGSQQSAEQLRTALNERLAAIQTDNATKLEEMRRTVDEKLHATLEQRLGESFKLVSDRLEQVHKGLGEMQTLAGSVGDLKRVMTNVKSRGTWGEMQLGAIIDNVLTPDQFGRNVCPSMPSTRWSSTSACSTPRRQRTSRPSLRPATPSRRRSASKPRRSAPNMSRPRTPPTLPCSTCRPKACLPRSCAGPAWSRPCRTTAAS